MQTYNTYTTSLEECKNETIISAFKKRVSISPNALALVYKNRRYSFQDVDVLSNLIACDLLKDGSKKGDVISIRTNRNELLMILPLAVLKMGGVYVPIDLSWPKEQIGQILEKSNTKVLLTDIDETLNISVKTKFVDIESLRPELSSTDIDYSFPEVLPNDTMCVFFTSGSTGTPKGVVHKHSSVFYMIVSDCWDNYVRKGDVLMYYMNFGFLFGHRIFQSIIAGVPLHIAPQELLQNFPALNEYMETNQVSITIMPTQVAFLFSESVNNKSLRILEIGGSATPRFNSEHKYKIVSAYGSTECLSAFNLEINSTTIISSIGKPNKLTEYILLNEKGEYDPYATTGEMLVSGPGIGCGYVSDSKLTSKKFVLINGKIYYRTGDLVEKCDNGEVVFKSRVDDMVKIHGLRVELGEISTILMNFPGITQAYVCVMSDQKSQHLCAYYTSLEGNSFDSSILKNYLQTRVQSYKIPDYFVHISEFPLSVRGKIHKEDLPNPCTKITEYEAPSGRKEEIVANAFSEVLGITTPISRHDNFIDLGGDSLGFMMLVGKLYKCGFDINFGIVKSNPVVKDIAAIISYKEFSDTKHEKSCIVSCNSLLKDVLHSNSTEQINDFNISSLYILEDKYDTAILRNTINVLVEKHMMLRSTIVGENINVRPYKENCNYVFYETEVEKDDEISHTIQLFEEKHNVYQNGMLSILLIRAKSANYIYILCSHCVSDAVSKQILYEDFCHIYQSLAENGKCKDMLERDTYKEYSDCITQFKNTSYCKSQKDYWRSVMQKVVNSSLSRPDTEQDYKSHYNFCKISISEDESRQIVDSNNLFIDILSAIVFTLTQEYEIRCVPINIVHHGRDVFYLSDNGKHYLSLERTIGCFPYVFPVCIDVNEPKKVGSVVQRFIDEIPDNGFAYDALKLQGQMPFVHPIFCFDYVGHQKSFQDDNCILRQVQLPGQSSKEETTNFQSEFFVYAMEYNKKIKLFARYDKSMFSDEYAKHLLVSFKSKLIERHQ